MLLFSIQLHPPVPSPSRSLSSRLSSSLPGPATSRLPDRQSAIEKSLPRFFPYRLSILPRHCL